MSLNLNNFEKLGVEYNASQYGNTGYLEYFSNMYNHMLNLVVDPSTREVKKVTFDNQELPVTEETLNVLVSKYNQEKNRAASNKQIIPGNNYGNFDYNPSNGDVTEEVPESIRIERQQYDSAKIIKDFVSFTNETNSVFATDIFKAISRVVNGAPCDPEDISGSDLVFNDNEVVSKRSAIISELEKYGYNDLADIVLIDPQKNMDIINMKKKVEELQKRIDEAEKLDIVVGQRRLAEAVEKSKTSASEEQITKPKTI